MPIIDVVRRYHHCSKSQRGDNQRMGSMLWISIVGRGAFGKEQETKLKRKAKSILRT